MRGCASIRGSAWRNHPQSSRGGCPFLGAGGEAGGIDDDHVVAERFLEGVAEEIEGVHPGEAVGGGVEVVVGEVALAPVQVAGGDIDAGGDGAGACRGDGEGAGVGEGVEDGGRSGAGLGKQCCDVAVDEDAVVALVEEEAGGKAVVEPDFEVPVGFADDERLGEGLAGEGGGV